MNPIDLQRVKVSVTVPAFIFVVIFGLFCPFLSSVLLLQFYFSKSSIFYTFVYLLSVKQFLVLIETVFVLLTIAKILLQTKKKNALFAHLI